MASVGCVRVSCLLHIHFLWASSIHIPQACTVSPCYEGCLEVMGPRMGFFIVGIMSLALHLQMHFWLQLNHWHCGDWDWLVTSLKVKNLACSYNASYRPVLATSSWIWNLVVGDEHIWTSTWLYSTESSMVLHAHVDHMYFQLLYNRFLIVL